MAFNPIKETIDGKKAHDMIWSSAVLDIAVKGIEQGKRLVANPFYENNIKLLKGDIVFERTEKEKKEWLKCRDDIIYFANTYCKLLTPTGIQNVEMRDYQEDYLKHLVNNRLSIFLSCRQSGKCLLLNTLIKIRLKTDDKLKKSKFKNYHLNDNIYEIPLFEIVNLYNKSFRWKIIYYLYKIINKKQKISNFLYKIISFLDSFDKQDDKLVYSHITDGIEVLSESGWSPVAYIHKTKKYNIYTIKTKTGKILNCADEHRVFTPDFNCVWITDLKIGTKILTDDGIDEVIEITKSQTSVGMGDITVLNNNESYYSNGILSHNTTTSAIFMLHYILFNFDKNSLVLGNKRRTAIEVLSKLKKIFYELPYFLKPGVYKWNEGEINLDNGCMCMAEATTINSGISFTFHCVLADEFAHIQPNILDKFYNNLFPVITAGKARFMISSTQNGYNLFYRLWCGAVDGENEYKPFKVDWWQVPEWNPDKQCFEKRDERWHQIQIANYGGEENFNKQFGTNFNISGNSLVNSKKMNTLATKLVDFQKVDMPGCVASNYFYWNPNSDVTPFNLKEHFSLMTIDISEASGGDYIVAPINVLRQHNQEVSLECVGYFYTNENGYKWAAEAIRDFCIKYLPDQTKYMISVELNLYGELFINYMKNIIDLDTMTIHFFNEDSFVKYYNESMTKYEFGARMTHASKSKYCKRFKSSIEEDSTVCPSTRFHNELTNFCDATGNGTYKATFGHDDFVMAEVQTEAVKTTVQWKNFKEDFLAYAAMRGNSPRGNLYSQFTYFQQFTTQDYFNTYQQEPSLYDFNDIDPDQLRLNRLK